MLGLREEVEKLLEVKETFVLSNIYDLKNHCWSGALDRIDEAIEKNIGDKFFKYIIDIFDFKIINDEEIDITEINDFIWFECDEWLEENTNKNDNE